MNLHSLILFFITISFVLSQEVISIGDTETPNDLVTSPVAVPDISPIYSILPALSPGDEEVVTEDACVSAMTSICNLGDKYSFEESLRCLESHVNELQGACSSALNVMLSNLHTDCASAVSSLCSSDTAGSESVYVLSCLSNHQSELSADCQQQFDTYLSQEYPCAKEASLFCAQESSRSPEHTLGCLETVAAASPGEISLECSTILHGFSICKEGGEEDRGKPKPKAKPAARRRTQSREDQKPKPKPKPAPGEGEHACWALPGATAKGSASDGSAKSYLTSPTNLSLDTNTEPVSETTHVTGIVVGSLIAVVVVIGLFGVKYKNKVESGNSNNGYWRAPSIQAMIFDDTVHHYVDRDEEGDRSDATKSTTVDAIEVRLSPIAHSDEVRA